MPYIIIGIVVVLLIYISVTYNSLTKLKNRVEEAFATMDVYLKKRWDLIPNIIETVKGYAEHEKSTLEAVTNLRTGSYDQMTNADKVSLNNQLTQGITKLMALAESYPDLKANQNFNQLTNELTQVETDIANARKYYNATIRTLNDKIEMFPSNLIAKIFGFKTLEMFEIPDAERENVHISF